MGSTARRAWVGRLRDAILIRVISSGCVAVLDGAAARVATSRRAGVKVVVAFAFALVIAA